MVHFQTSSSWTAIKKFTGEFFNWIREHKVYLNSTRFKTDTLAPASFLEGAHTGDLRRNEAELELLGSLGLEESYLFNSSPATSLFLCKAVSPRSLLFKL
jgi:hypothetical protein